MPETDVSQLSSQITELTSEIKQIREHIFQFLSAFGNKQVEMSMDMTKFKAAFQKIGHILCEVSKE